MILLRNELYGDLLWIEYKGRVLENECELASKTLSSCSCHAMVEILTTKLKLEHRL